ncbi:MAG: hypothetical protein ACRCUP_04805 [Mycoplasmatales bacterium]
MKKLFALLLVTVLGLAGCTAGASTSDSTTDSTMDSTMDSTTPVNYKGEVKLSDVEMTTITFTKTGSDITNVMFASTKDGADKADAEQYPLVKVGGGKADWSVQADMVAKFIEENDGVDKINVNAAGKDADAVTGATIGVTEFVESFKAAQEVK